MRAAPLVLSILVLTTSAILRVPCARAGNDDGILVGGQAALTAGALTATVSDGSAAWYNPAGLAHVTRHSLDINASAYGVSLVSAKNLFTLPDGRQSNASYIDWQLIPTALSYTRVLGRRLVGSFGVMIPYATDLDLRTAVDQANGTRWQLGLDNYRNEYDYILTLGMRVTPSLRVGVSLHGIYISSESMIQVGTGVPGVSETRFQSSSTHETSGDYGARMGLGVQWSPSPVLDLGLALQTPTLTGVRKTSDDEVTGVFPGGGNTQGVFRSRHVSEVSSVWDLTTPLVVRMGAALRVKRAQLSIDGSVSSALRDRDPSLARKLSGNMRMACALQASPALTYGVGLFSDTNSFRQRAPNFLGLAGGVRIASNYSVREGERALTFATTVAARYAYGWGTTLGLSFGEDGSATPRGAPVHAHELALNVGGSVTF